MTIKFLGRQALLGSYFWCSSRARNCAQCAQERLPCRLPVVGFLPDEQAGRELERLVRRDGLRDILGVLWR